MLPIALIDRVEAAIAGIAHTQPPPANATDQQALQQTKALSGRSGEYFAVRSVGRQAVAVGEELIPADIPRMVIGNDDAPLVLRHPARLGADLAGRSNLLASLVSPEHVGAGIRWIRQDTEHPRMGKSTPEQFAIPGAAVRPTRKAKPQLLEALDYAVRAALSFEQFKDRSNGALHFLVRVKCNLVVVKDQANRQREVQLTLMRFVELAAVEARADDVQLCLGERALHAEHKAVFELGRVVTAVLVDYQRAGDGAQLEQAMPILVRSCKPRRLQREDGPDLPHCHIADQRLEVLAICRSGAGLTEIPVEDPDLFRIPAHGLRLVRQIVLALGALLIEADLPRRRLTNVDAGVPRQMSIGNLGDHHDRLPLGWTAGRPQQGRIRSCRR